MPASICIDAREVALFTSYKVEKIPGRTTPMMYFLPGLCD
jgi:hypothetical protein